ncbi:MAG: putative quinol monooxygenase [Alphaproteobacteria bacterium]|nr:putative quinol monooxygenase [Alphaproteobacteria bacterium]
MLGLPTAFKALRMLIVTGALTARPETLARLAAICVEHSQRSRAEPGCLNHNVHADCENPLRLFFYEEWADDAALKARFRVPESNAFMTEARSLVTSAEGPSIFAGDKR